MRSFLLLCGALALGSSSLLTGCGSTVVNTSAGCYLTSLPASSTSANSSFSLVPSNSQISIYPGGTTAVDVYVKPLSSSASGTVSITATGLPQGITSTTVQAAIGSTAHLQLTAAASVAPNCFTSVEGVDSAEVAFYFSSSNSAGTSKAGMALNIQLENPSFVPTSTNLPVMSIATDDAAPITSKDDDVTGTVTITDTAHPTNNYSGTMSVKGHGNSTWLYMPKKPYRVKLDSKSGLFGMNSAKSWILLANYGDKTMLRNYLAFYLSQTVGMAWTPSSAFVELFVNGQYEGVYQVTEKVEVDKNRLNIGEMDDTDISGDDLTGGYIGEIDTYQDETFTMHTATSNLPIGLDDPDPPVDVQSAYFAQQLNAADASLFAANFTDTAAGWPAHWDQDSLVKWFIVEELMSNQDSDDYSDLIFYKPRSDPRFYMGPIWDFDISSGNVYPSPSLDPTVPWVRAESKWYKQLFKDPAFLAAVKAEWKNVRPQMANLNTYLDTQAATLSLGAQNNYQRWTTLGVLVWPNAETAGSYTGEVQYLKDWMTKRIAYMDATYGQ